MSGSIGCVKAATQILGDKWTPQLLRCLGNENSLRFCRLQDEVGNINPRTLSSRLTMLEQKGIIEKSTCQDSARCEYKLTSKGKDLMPILRDMQRWSEKHHQAPTAIV